MMHSNSIEVQENRLCQCNELKRKREADGLSRTQPMLQNKSQTKYIKCKWCDYCYCNKCKLRDCNICANLSENDDRASEHIECKSCDECDYNDIINNCPNCEERIQCRFSGHILHLCKFHYSLHCAEL
jgi:hypothetical protein